MLLWRSYLYRHDTTQASIVNYNPNSAVIAPLIMKECMHVVRTFDFSTTTSCILVPRYRYWQLQLGLLG